MLKHIGISQTELARQIEVEPSVLSQSGSDTRPTISAKVVSKIVNRYPQINPWWLLMGEGEMLLHEKTEKNPANGVDVSFDALRSLLKEYERRLAEYEKEIKDLKDEVRLLKGREYESKG